MSGARGGRGSSVRGVSGVASSIWTTNPKSRIKSARCLLNDVVALNSSS
jgi:hypothetical protein